jgi:hypothetical protein
MTGPRDRLPRPPAVAGVQAEASSDTSGATQIWSYLFHRLTNLLVISLATGEELVFAGRGRWLSVTQTAPGSEER